jgi:hypothetical protein
VAAEHGAGGDLVAPRVAEALGVPSRACATRRARRDRPGDEAEEAWLVVEPVPAARHDGLVSLEHHPAGSDGPEDAPERK